MSGAFVDSGVVAARGALAGAAGAPVILAIGGISASRWVVRDEETGKPGWWANVAGPGRFLDTRTHRILGVDFVDGGRAADGRPTRLLTTMDQAAAIVALLDELAIERLDAVVGASYGGMVALAMGAGWPERIGRLVVISAAERSHPMATALRALQRRIVELGLETGRAFDAMTLARGIAMTTYRTAAEFSERFDTAPIVGERDAEFPVEGYLRHVGRTFAERMPPERFLALSLSADLHDVDPARVLVPTATIAAEGDTLVPPEQIARMAARLPRSLGHHLLETRYGHDAFLIEPERLGAILTPILAD